MLGAPNFRCRLKSRHILWLLWDRLWGSQKGFTLSPGVLQGLINRH